MHPTKPTKSILKDSVCNGWITPIEKAQNLIISLDGPAAETVRGLEIKQDQDYDCLLYTSPSPRDRTRSRMPSSA